ncbi:hypothetical protein U1Q18_008480 [Sarracenia purpurea var. burkii]
MEEAQYWMWPKRKHTSNNSHHLQPSTNPNSYGDNSWEEQAFAEDAAGPLGGCIWPPRSYSCSFCRREFRSAQALGGHMNVHRRDRARLKQSSPNPQNELLHHHHHQNHRNHIPLASLDFQNPNSQIPTMIYIPNPQSDHVVLRSSSPVSPPPAQENPKEKKISFPIFSSQLIEEHHKKTSLLSSPPRSNLVADKYNFHISNRINDEKNPKFLESKSSSGAHEGDYVKADLSVSLNLFVCRTRPVSHGGKEDEEEEESLSFKRRRRTDSTPLIQSFLKSKSTGTNHVHSELLQLSPSSEDLDLELRLGDRPEVK